MNPIQDLLNKVERLESELRNAKMTVCLLVDQMGGKVELENDLLTHPPVYNLKLSGDPAKDVTVLEVRRTRTIEGTVG